MSRFSFRYKIEKDFEQWCKRNNIKNCAMNFVAFLEKRYDVDIETLPYSQEEIFRRLEIMENAIDEAEKKQPVDESVRNKTMCYEPLTVKKRKLLVTSSTFNDILILHTWSSHTP